MSKRRLARRDPEARQALLLAAAARSFAKRGYENTSVNHVAEEAGVAVGTLYKYWPDKPALLEAVLADFEADFVRGLQQVRELPLPAFSRLELMVAGLFTLASERESFYWALNAGTHGLRGGRDSTPGAALREEIRLFIEDGMADGSFRKVDATRVAALGYGVVETAMRHCFSPSERGAHVDRWKTAVYEMLARNVTP
jgi:AcrR family transcriptional regulator